MWRNRATLPVKWVFLPGSTESRLTCYLSLMRQISSHSQQAALSWQRRPGPRRAAGAGLSAAALIALAACGSSNANGSGGSGGTSLTPRDALVAAVIHTQKVTSAVETLNV